MNLSEILTQVDHRSVKIPSRKWNFYQEWNDAVFIHFKVDLNELKNHISAPLEIDTFNGEAYASIVSFTMNKVRPRGLPSVGSLSNFTEINLRTYVKYKGKQGVYFLNIQAGNTLASFVAKTISGLNYQAASIKHKFNHRVCTQSNTADEFEFSYRQQKAIENPSELDLWLTERYRVFNERKGNIDTFEVHHLPWKLEGINVELTKINYPKFNSLLSTAPFLCHYSPGVQVLTWNKS